MPEMQILVELVNSLGLLGFSIAALYYVDHLRRDEKKEANDRTDDIINDWKKLRGLEDMQRD